MVEFANSFQYTGLNAEEKMEEKVHSARTKRRRIGGSMEAISRRVTRLAKSLKASNPAHVYVSQASSAFSAISTTGSLYEICGNIAQVLVLCSKEPSI